MKIIEKQIISKNNDMNICEDDIISTNDFICLVDGATSKSSKIWDNNKKSGYIAKEIVIDYFKKCKKNLTAKELIKELTLKFKDKYNNDFNHYLNNPKDRIEASIIVYSHFRKQIWIYGDCQLLINNKLYLKERLVSQINSNARSLYNNILLSSGVSFNQIQEEDPGRNLILPILEKTSIYANKNGEYAYPILNGIDYNEKLLSIIKVKEGDKIVFASDGYPILHDTLKDSEKDLKRILKIDPLFINEFKSTKGLKKNQISFDDRSYIKFIID